MTPIKSQSGILFMKVGVHDGEPFEEILERKRNEISNAGVSFWGYGGSTCHPLQQVQPFAKLKIEERENIYLVMEQIHSNHPPTNHIASLYSSNGRDWTPIPDGIEVRGSRYAVVINEILDGDLDIDLSHYKVAYGPSSGKNASDYIQGRVDKGCIDKIKVPQIGFTIPSTIKKISHYGRIVDPFAVFVK